jgi:hypothetical protein
MTFGIKAAAAVALCAGLLAAPVPAAAERAPGATLRMMVAVKNGPTRTATLTCFPAGGSHSSPHRACRLLHRASGDPARLNARPQAVCTREFRPAAVVVTGRWRDRVISFGRVYSNPCLLRAAGGAVYAF